jgi:hypothetical protein
MVSAGKRSGSGVNTNNPTNSATSAHSITACVHDGQRRSFDSTTVYGKLNLRVRATSTERFVFEQPCFKETHSTTRFDFLASECHSHISRIRYSEHIVPAHLQCKLNFSTDTEVILLPVAPALVHVSTRGAETSDTNSQPLNASVVIGGSLHQRSKQVSYAPEASHLHTRLAGAPQAKFTN